MRHLVPFSDFQKERGREKDRGRRRSLRPAGLLCIALLFSALFGADVSITDFGAKEGGATPNTAAIQKAIDTASTSGGGRVRIPPGVWATAGLVLKDGVKLHLERGATLMAPRSISEYESGNRRFLSAVGARDIGIEGEGTLNGGGDAYWVQTGKKETGDEDWTRASHNGWEGKNRPKNLYFLFCTNVSLSGVTVTNSPEWTVHLENCDRVAVTGLTIRNPAHGPNTDGIDVNRCQDVVIRGCDIMTGDDAVVLKSRSTQNRRPTRNILVEDCLLDTECQALKIGTETLEDFEDIVFRNCRITNRSTRLDERASAGIALEAVDGGTVRGVTVSNIQMWGVKSPIFIRLGNRGNGQTGPKKIPGGLRDILLKDITAHGAYMESSITGIPGARVEQVRFENIQLEIDGGGDPAWADMAVKEAESAYPAPRMFGTRLPAWGLYVRHVSNLTLSRVAFRATAPDGRPAVVADDAQGVTLDGVTASPSRDGRPPVSLVRVNGLSVLNSFPGVKEPVAKGADCENLRIEPAAGPAPTPIPEAKPTGSAPAPSSAPVAVTTTDDTTWSVQDLTLALVLKMGGAVVLQTRNNTTVQDEGGGMGKTFSGSLKPGKSTPAVTFTVSVTPGARGTTLTWTFDTLPEKITDVFLSARLGESMAGKTFTYGTKSFTLPGTPGSMVLAKEMNLTEVRLPQGPGSLRLASATPAGLFDRRGEGMGYFEWRIPFKVEGNRRTLTLTLASDATPPAVSKGNTMDDNNYQLDAVAGSKKESDPRFQPKTEGTGMVLSPRNRYSPGRDLIYYTSSRNPELELAMLVTKPVKPGHLLATTHGWHMDIGGFSFLEKPNGDYLRVAVDMRGRKYSQGKADANGYELLDVYDAIQVAKKLYREHLTDPGVLYFDAGSGGGGNSLGLVGKFPDLFAAATANCGISDYGLWWETDTIGEFRDELLPWIGTEPEKNPMAYASRGGLTTVANLLTPITIAHGETDSRVTVEQARRYVAKAKALGKAHLVNYLELPGVGNRDHWGNATKEQKEAMLKQAEDNRLAHRAPIAIPRKGRFVVAGYLVTKSFSIWLDSIDKVATVDYDLDAGTFKVTGDVPVTHEVVKGPWPSKSPVAP